MAVILKFEHVSCYTFHTVGTWQALLLRQRSMCALSDRLTSRIHINIVTLPHWGQMTHISVSKLTINGSDNGLSHGRRQPIIWTNAWVLLIGPLGINISGISIEIYIFSFKKMHFKLLSGNWWQICLGLNVLNKWQGVSINRCHWGKCKKFHCGCTMTILSPQRDFLYL